MFVCISCNQQMRPKKNSYRFVEMAKMTDGSEQVPYKIWDGDLWECQGCGASIVHTDPRQLPVNEHYKPGFSEACANLETSAKEWTRAA